MTTITVQLQGKLVNLQDALIGAAHWYSAKKITGNVLTLSYICETSDWNRALQDTQDCIDLGMLEAMNVELLSIG